MMHIDDNVAIALVGTIVPTVTVVLTWLQQRRAVANVHDVVNGNHTKALEAIETLKAEIVRLNSPNSAPTVPDKRASVIVDPTGVVRIANGHDAHESGN